MQAIDQNPLIQALQNKAKLSGAMGPQDLLDFILTHYDLVPKEEENEKPVNVQTQESHVP